jgi:alpha-N-arabinofuranosidase
LPDARATIDPTRVVGTLDPRIFGGLVEHLGRAVYGGIYEPGHPTADADGWRHDVAALVRELGVTVVRYPGGNFVSGYDWEDGIGPRAARPPRLDRAWRTMESNQVGTDDFIDWTRLVGVEAMLAVNLGTRGPGAAADLVAYANLPVGTPAGDRRAANGHADPHDVRLWCLGNEMDGPWQIGARPAPEYARLARESALAIRAVDPRVELVACGSSGLHMPTFGAWDRTVLEVTGDAIDHLSLHHYVDPGRWPSVEGYLASSRELDTLLDVVGTIVDETAMATGSRRRIGLSVDEWNVWRFREHEARVADLPSGSIHEAPPAIAEDTHDLTDALVVGCLLISLLRHADRVRISCVAQLVNVIPLIRTIDGGPAWWQASAHVFAMAARSARGIVLRLDLDGPLLEVPDDEPAAAIEATAIHDVEAGRLTILAVNRATRPLTVVLDVRRFGQVRVEGGACLDDPDPAAANSAESPDRVVPRPVDGVRAVDGTVSAVLAARSWTVLRVLVESVGAAT